MTSSLSPVCGYIRPLCRRVRPRARSARAPAPSGRELLPRLPRLLLPPGGEPGHQAEELARAEEGGHGSVGEMKNIINSTVLAEDTVRTSRLRNLKKTANQNSKKIHGKEANKVRRKLANIKQNAIFVGNFSCPGKINGKSALVVQWPRSPYRTNLV